MNIQLTHIKTILFALHRNIVFVICQVTLFNLSVNSLCCSIVLFVHCWNETKLNFHSFVIGQAIWQCYCSALFFFKIAIAIFNSMHCHLNIRISSIKILCQFLNQKSAGILIGITLNLWVQENLTSLCYSFGFPLISFKISSFQWKVSHIIC